MQSENLGKLPNLLIAGVNRSGTTSLFVYLIKHPEICGASRKETGYYRVLYDGTAEFQPIESYMEYFKDCGDEKLRLEATPHYIYGEAVIASAIRRDLGEDVKLIFLLRDPVGRFVSAFNFHKAYRMSDIGWETSPAEYLEMWKRSTPRRA